MKAVVRTEYGPPEVVRVEDVAMPTPASNEVLIRVVAASVNGSDREGLIGRPAYSRLAGLRRPRYPILKSDIAGKVEQVGKDVRNLRIGDAVLGEMPGYHSGFAEYVRVPESYVVPKPATLTFDSRGVLVAGVAGHVDGCRRVRVGQFAGRYRARRYCPRE